MSDIADIIQRRFAGLIDPKDAPRLRVLALEAERDIDAVLATKAGQQSEEDLRSDRLRSMAEENERYLAEQKRTLAAQNRLFGGWAPEE